MEFKIYNPQEEGFLKEIDWNYEELKTEIQKKANDYMNLVYTADQIKDAKKDRANLRKFVTALENKRKEIKRQVMQPYTAFEEQEKELILSSIGHHRKGDSRSTLAALLYKADKQSRNCFLCSAASECYWSDDKKNMKIEY